MFHLMRLTFELRTCEINDTSKKYCRAQALAQTSKRWLETGRFLGTAENYD